MLDIAIVDSDRFLDMSATAQLLYFHLSMRADDEGFIDSTKKIMRIAGAIIDDLNSLASNGFIIKFESGVIVIKHWKINNYLNNTRIKKTLCNDEKKLLALDENNEYILLGLTNV